MKIDDGNFNLALPAADWKSPAIPVGQSIVASIHVLLSNTDWAGDLYVQATNDDPDTDASWQTLYHLSKAGVLTEKITITGGSDVNEILYFADLGCAYLRLFFDRTAGSASGNDLVTWTYLKHPAK